ncbi:ent-kaurene oxidase [Aaosphaeria arxii CBS 175.79]|uniref:Ent-kaurene oxidase n=1 Tax=Aaosphaeria arxii CBS 175.79 TaxID=1450172 RepID=A0A6A5X6T6_9PLEO|nr:ent-kaurene oxidase [Aaosphaeria arxii CBS 175.79]KAF2008612.1 ent-kaurene oxidase [Aaosphaeria arxii CBS 175.79]
METVELHIPASPWTLALPLGADTRTYLYLILCLALSILACSHLLRKPTSSRPVLNPSGFEIIGLQRRIDFNNTAGGLITQGREKFPGKPYHLITDTCDLLVLPPTFAEGIRNNPDLDLTSTVEEDFHAYVPGFEAFRGGREDEITNMITEPLSRETDFALKQRFGVSNDWKEYKVYEEILDVVARISTRVFLGPELCRNEEWLRITKNYTVDSFIAAFVLRIFPRSLRSLVHWFLPQCRSIRQQLADARKLILPAVQARRKLRASVQAEGKVVPDFNDAIDWLDQEAKGDPYDVVSCQLGMSMAAIHTTTDLLTETMQNLAMHPELVEELRREIVEVLSAGGWKKTSLYNLKLMDSVLKESQRVRPAGTLVMQRKATRTTKLPDGSTLAKGQRCAVDSFGPSGMASSEVYDNPSAFDPHRFERMRGQPGLDSKAHLVATGPAHLGFGHGQHSCPGRFFASNELKVALCHLLIDYEWRFADGYTPKRMENGFMLGTDPEARILLRRRSQPEVELLGL